jgi:hypothetical protein
MTFLVLPVQRSARSNRVIMRLPVSSVGVDGGGGVFGGGSLRPSSEYGAGQ